MKDPILFGIAYHAAQKKAKEEEKAKREEEPRIQRLEESHTDEDTSGVGWPD